MATGESNPTGRLVQTRNPVEARIGGTTTTVYFAGGAPGLIGGVFHINIRNPAGLRTGLHIVEIDVAEQTTAGKQTVTVFVR